MDDVKPWIKAYFLNLATTYGSNFDSAPPVEKVKKCQLKKVLTIEPKDYLWVVLSDKELQVQCRFPKGLVEQCIKETKRDKRFTRHVGSLIEIRDFTPLFIRVEDGPSSSTPHKDLTLDIRKAKLRGAAGESIWGNPQPLESVADFKEWVRELRKPNGNRDILKIRKKQQDEAKAAKQLTEPWEFPPGFRARLPSPTRVPAATTPPIAERLPLQRYHRKWKKAVPGLNEFTRCLQIPDDVRSKILEKQKIKDAEAKSRQSGTVPINGPRNMRGALEIGSSPARLSSVPRATTPEEWPTSPGVLMRLYNDRETEMSSDVYSSRQSSPVDICHDAEMDGVGPQPEPETVPETPQILPDSQTQHLSPPPPAQPPRPRSPLPSSSNPQAQNHPTSPSSVHTSMQAVSGSQLPEKPPVPDRPDDVPSSGPSFVLPWTQHDDPPAAIPKSPPGSHPSPEKPATKPLSPIKEPTRPDPSKPQEKNAMVKETPRSLAFGESVFQAIAKAFREESSGEVASTSHGPPAALQAPSLTIAQLPPPKPRSKPPSKVIQYSLPGPPSDRLTEAEKSESPVRQPLQGLNRKVPAPEVCPTRKPVRGKNANGVATMVLVPASDDSKLSSSSKQHPSSQPVQSSQSVPSSLPVPPSAPLPPSQLGSSEPQIRHPEPQPEAKISQEDPVVVQVKETVPDVETAQDHPRNTQSSLEYASTQEDVKVAMDAKSQNSATKPPEIEGAAEKAGTEPLGSSLPQIVAICEVESPQSINEEIDELEGDSETGDRPPVAKRKFKTVPSKPPIEAPTRVRPGKVTKPNSPSKLPSEPIARPDSVVEKVPSRSSSKVPLVPVVVVERKRTPAPVVPTDERTHPAQKRRLTSPSDEGFPVPQSIKRSKINGCRSPAQTTLPQAPRTPEEDDVGSRMPKEAARALKDNQAAQKPVVSSASKGKGRAEGIKGLENLSTLADVGRETEMVQARVKKKAPDTGAKRKPSDAFSARDDSRDAKRPKVDKEPEPRRLGKQLSFVDPDKLKRPFHSKPQTLKASCHQETTAITDVVEPEDDGRTSKYFNAQLYREPKYPRMKTTPEAERLRKAAGSDEAAHENGRDSGDTRPRIDSRKTSKPDPDCKSPGKGRNPRNLDDDEPPGRSTANSRVQQPKPVKKVGRYLAPSQPRYPPARKLGSFAPDLNPPPLPGLPGGRLMNKQLREILIRTGKVRTREARAAESNHTGR